MAEKTMESWLRRRRPEVPPALLHQLLAGDDGLASPEALALRGSAALKKALDTPGGHRDRAFHLLAADAFLTYACEALAGTENVESGLEDLLTRLGAEFR
jgi:hypothetical protein